MTSDSNSVELAKSPFRHEHQDVSNLINSIPALVASVDCNMILKFSNRPFNNWFSIDGDVEGRSFPAVVGKEIFGQLQRHMGKVLVGSRANFQITVNTEKGFQCLEATLSPDFDDEKNVAGFIFHSSDITQKSRTERDLKDYFENASIGLHWVDSAGIIIWANPAELAMLGYTADEYIGRHFSEFYANKNASIEVLDRLARKDTLRNYEAELLCKDGSTRHVNINSTVLWEADKFVHTRCFIIDVTDQKVAARAVRESEERFKMMANLIPLVIWTTDNNGSCDFLSIKWKELTGKNTTEGLGQGWQNEIHPEDREKIRHSWMRSFSARKSFEAKFRYLNSEGLYNVSYANSSPTYNASGEFGGYIGILQDISSEERIKSSLEKIVLLRTEDLKRRNSALKAVEKTLLEKNLELERINAELSSFAHIASHDLQEPLRKILTFSHRLLEVESSRLSVQGTDYLKRIKTSSERMRALIKDLLDYSTSGKNGERFEQVDLNAVLDEVLTELDVKVHEKKATIRNFGLPHLSGIRFQFHQLFLNLVGNALKFSRDHVAPCVEIRSAIGDAVAGGPSHTQKNYHHISITDNGIGFDSQYSHSIFEIFQRLNAKGFDGTGIGLAICKKIVENHGGKIWAEGKLNEGATFHIILPAG